MQTNGFQPIHVAAAMGCISIVKKLVEHYKVPVEPIALVNYKHNIELELDLCIIGWS